MSVRATKVVAAAILALIWAVGAAGCVTIGYDFLKQQATVTFDGKTSVAPSSKLPAPSSR